MAISSTFHVATTASATTGTTVAPAVAIPDNCHTIIISNPDTSNSVLFARGTASGGSALSASTSTTLAGATIITLTIGPKSDRPDPSSQLVYSSVGGAITVNITYICSVFL